MRRKSMLLAAGTLVATVVAACGGGPTPSSGNGLLTEQNAIERAVEHLKRPAPEITGVGDPRNPVAWRMTLGEYDQRTGASRSSEGADTPVWVVHVEGESSDAGIVPPESRQTYRYAVAVLDARTGNVIATRRSNEPLAWPTATDIASVSDPRRMVRETPEAATLPSGLSAHYFHHPFETSDPLLQQAIQIALKDGQVASALQGKASAVIGAALVTEREVKYRPCSEEYRCVLVRINHDWGSLGVAVDLEKREVWDIGAVNIPLHPAPKIDHEDAKRIALGAFRAYKGEQGEANAWVKGEISGERLMKTCEYHGCLAVVVTKETGEAIVIVAVDRIDGTAQVLPMPTSPVGPSPSASEPSETPIPLSTILFCSPQVAQSPCGDGVQVGVPYEFRLYTHCGIRSAYFDGRWWVASPLLENSSNPPEGWGNPMDTGAMTLVREDFAHFRNKAGKTADFRPLAPTEPYTPVPCF